MLVVGLVNREVLHRHLERDVLVERHQPLGHPRQLGIVVSIGRNRVHAQEVAESEGLRRCRLAHDDQVETGVVERLEKVLGETARLQL